MSEMCLFNRSSGSYSKTRLTLGETYWNWPFKERTWTKSGLRREWVSRSVGVTTGNPRKTLTIRIRQYQSKPFRLACLFSSSQHGRLRFRRKQAQHFLRDADRRWWQGFWSWFRCRFERRLGIVLDRVIDLVGSVSHVSQDGVGLFDEIDLETDMVDDLIAVPCDGHDRDQIDAKEMGRA